MILRGDAELPKGFESYSRSSEGHLIQETLSLAPTGMPFLTSRVLDTHPAFAKDHDSLAPGAPRRHISPQHRSRPKDCKDAFCGAEG